MSRILVVDANSYVVRLAVIESDGHFHAGLDSKPNQYEKQLQFIRSQALQCSHHISVAGSPLDRWPTELHHTLAEEVGSHIDWILPEFVRQTSLEVALWQQRRKFDRARLIALASASRVEQAIEPHRIVRLWQRRLIDEMLQRLTDITPMDSY
jgi:hypothetical protein